MATGDLLFGTRVRKRTLLCPPGCKLWKLAGFIDQDRREFLRAAASLLLPPTPVRANTRHLYRKARQIVASGRLGPLAFVRAWGGFSDIVPLALGNPRPVSLSTDCGIATVRYPAVIASFDAAGDP